MSALSDSPLTASPNDLYVGGQWRAASGGGRLPIEDPATGETLTDVADAAPEDALAALDAACDVQPGWARTTPRERGEILRRAYEAVMADLEDLALLITLEMGKPLSEARAEVTYAADFFHWFAGEATRIDGRWTTAEKGGSRVLVSKSPVGPCLFITPWNFPLAMGTRKIGPAIASGCTMVVKPAGQTPLAMLRLAKILEDAGLPAGVLNVVTSSHSGALMAAIIEDPRLRKLSFTGSTEVGRLLVEQSAKQLLRVSMELGGNAPFLVFADADVDEAVAGAMVAKMRNIGEACTAANRFLVHEAVAEEFATKFSERMSALRLGHGSLPDTDVGPIIDGTQRERLDDLVRDAVAVGASVATGGHAIDGPGYFYAPTVLTDVPDEARMLHEEVFGPVAPIRTFADEDEAIAVANDTEYGLIAYAYTRDLQRGIRIMESLETGMVGLNQGVVSSASAPFGGVKHSGFGREGGREGIEDYLVTKYTAIKM
jgi:succinate-semialdehyde dehydrogenase / glutarate-semialdehyde dehydrogenase